MKYCPYWPARVSNKELISFNFFYFKSYYFSPKDCVDAVINGKNALKQNMCAFFRHQTIVSVSVFVVLDRPNGAYIF